MSKAAAAILTFVVALLATSAVAAADHEPPCVGSLCGDTIGIGIDGPWQVPEASRGVHTGRWLLSGQSATITGTGTIWAGVFATGVNGPEGWPNHAAPASYPRPGAPVYGLLVDIGGVRSHVGRQGVFTNTTPGVAEIVFLTNDNVPGNGSGAFSADIVAGRLWDRAGHAHGVVAMTSMAHTLYALTGDGSVWRRTDSTSEVNWALVERRSGLVTLAALGDRLYATTTGNRLITRPAVTAGLPSWTDIGHAINVTAMTGDGKNLYATTADNRLWRRPPVDIEVNWSVVGAADAARELTATGEGQLVALGRDQRIRTIDLTAVSPQWSVGYPANGIVALAHRSGLALWAATTDGNLLMS